MSFKSEYHMKGVDLAMNHSNVKPTTKKRAKAVLSVFLVVAILIAGAYAFLSATDSKTNVFTVGNVKIGLWEKFDTDLGGSLEDDETFDSTKTEVSIEEGKTIIPGQTILKQPMVENTGKNPAYIFMAVGVPTATDANIKANQLGDKLQIKVKAFAVQEKYKQADNATAAWEAYRDTVKENLGTQDTSEGIELFALNNAQNSDWTVAKETAASTNDFTYKTDGYVYHFYILSAALPVGNTLSSSPIESVTFNSDVGAGDLIDNVTVELDNLRTIDSGTIIPEGCTLITENGTKTYNEGDTVPASYVPSGESRDGDEFITPDYTYTYTYCGNDAISKDNLSDTAYGWGVYVNDDSKESYSPIYKTLFGKDLKDIGECFFLCTNLIEAPAIPDGVESIEKAFYGCSSLKKVPNIPTSAIYLREAFKDCTSLISAPAIHKEAVDIQLIFMGDTSLAGAITVDCNPSLYDGCFSGTQITEVRGLTTLKAELLATKD